MSRDALVISPFSTEIGGFDESVPIGKLLGESQCPSFSVNSTANAEADIVQFQAMNSAGISAVISHGVVGFRELEDAVKDYFGWEHEGSQALLITGENFSCDSMESAPTPCSSNGASCGKGSRCVFTEVDGTTSSGVCLDQVQADLKKGRLALTGSGRMAVLPSFVRNQAQFQEYPNSLVYLGACDSMWNGSLASAFYLAGARAVLGYTGTVTSEFANQKGQELFTSLLSGQQLVGAAVISEADSLYPDTWFRLVGATNLDVNQSEIINADFEIAPKKKTGWSSEGDARVVNKLGDSKSVLGKYMAILSTGLGYTQEIGEMSQTFCIPQDVTQVSFWWKFYSEEFIEFCGSQYQDAFEATISGTVGGGEQVLTLVSTNVDKLCPPEECTGCGEMYESLVQSSVSFDDGGVWNTEWREQIVDISQFSGQGPVTLRFFAGDTGDSIYDTAVLIDSLVFE